MITKITNKEGINIIRKWELNQNDESIKGQYYYKEDSLYIGIDNRTNDCWVEEFNNLNDCLLWLQ